MEVVFVDVADTLVEALSARRGYEITLVGPEAGTFSVERVRAVHGRDRVRVAGEVAAAEIVSTAVGAAALPHVAPALAAGLLARHKGTGAPLNILLCENLRHAAAQARAEVEVCLPEKDRETILQKTGFVQAIVSRMVPARTSEESARDPLGIRVEAYKRLPVDARSVVGRLPAIPGIEPVFDFAAHLERKLYTHNCAHAVLGYLGHAAGFHSAFQALEDPRIRARLEAVLQETGTALARRHRFTAADQTGYERDLLARFANRELGDTCLRLARDPLRKLAPEDRLSGAARLCEGQGIRPEALAGVIAVALRHSDPTDPSALELQRRLAEQGLAELLRTLCGISAEEPLGRMICRAAGRL